MRARGRTHPDRDRSLPAQGVVRSLDRSHEANKETMTAAERSRVEEDISSPTKDGELGSSKDVVITVR